MVLLRLLSRNIKNTFSTPLAIFSSQHVTNNTSSSRPPRKNINQGRNIAGSQKRCLIDFLDVAKLFSNKQYILLSASQRKREVSCTAHYLRAFSKKKKKLFRFLRRVGSAVPDSERAKGEICRAANGIHGAARSRLHQPRDSTSGNELKTSN